MTVFLKETKKAIFTCQILDNFYRGATEITLTGNITNWHGMCTTQEGSSENIVSIYLLIYCYLVRAKKIPPPKKGLSLCLECCVQKYLLKALKICNREANGGLSVLLSHCQLMCSPCKIGRSSRIVQWDRTRAGVCR